LGKLADGSKLGEMRHGQGPKELALKGFLGELYSSGSAHPLRKVAESPMAFRDSFFPIQAMLREPRCSLKSFISLPERQNLSATKVAELPGETQPYQP
jgi:hypothetical protein